MTLSPERKLKKAAGWVTTTRHRASQTHLPTCIDFISHKILNIICHDCYKWENDELRRQYR